MNKDVQFMAPQSEAYIGPWKTQKIHEIKVISSRNNPIDLASIQIPSAGVAIDAITKGMPVNIFMGYREHGLWPVFSGVVDDVNWGEIVTIRAKDGMQFLKETMITQTFVDVQPREIMRFCLTKAQVSQYEISMEELPRKHYFVAAGQNVLQVQKLLNQTWGLDWEFYREPEGEIIFKPWKETARHKNSQPVVYLEYGKNLLDLKTTDYESGSLRTFLLPMLRHGHVLSIIDRRYWATEALVKIQRITAIQGIFGAEAVIEWQKIQDK